MEKIEIFTRKFKMSRKGSTLKCAREKMNSTKKFDIRTTITVSQPSNI
jgi:hypothetical protein